MKKHLLSVLCCLLILSMLTVAFSGCNKNEPPAPPSETDERESDDSEIQYNVPAEDMGNFELDVLTVKSGTWNMHTDFAPDNMSGDRINDAVYDRNTAIEQEYNCIINAHEDAEYYKGTEKLSIDQLSGTGYYDTAYVEGSSVVSLITQGLLHNLYDVPELQLEKDWWSQLIKKEATIGSNKYATLYFMQSNLSLTAFDLTWCVYFNKSIHESHQLEDLYDLVRQDKWTVEAMQTVARAVANLNGDETYSYNETGKSVYGITTYWNGAKAMLDGCNVQFVISNSNDELVSNITTERFMNLAQRLAQLFGEPGTFTNGGPSTDGSTKGNASDYIKIFNANRALFCIAEVKSSVSDFSVFQGDFGILPLPKYEEGQEGYRSWVNYLAPVLVIPQSTQGDTLHKTALLLDALSFYSERDVLPEYYDKVLKGRGVKDADSSAMLDLINETKTFDASIAYGWSRQFSEVVSTTILAGVTDVSSLIEQYDEMIAENIKETMDSIYQD